jgi:hypothetical protein
LQWKAKNGVSDKGFGQLLAIQKNMLSKENELLATTYEAKQAVCPLGLEVQKIYAVLMTAFSIVARTTRIWMHAQYAMHHGTRSDEMM